MARNSKAIRLGTAIQRNLPTQLDRAKTAGMPDMINRPRYAAAREAYLGTDELTHAQLLEHQMAEAGDE